MGQIESTNSNTSTNSNKNISQINSNSQNKPTIMPILPNKESSCDNQINRKNINFNTNNFDKLIKRSQILKKFHSQSMIDFSIKTYSNLINEYILSNSTNLSLFNVSTLIQFNNETNANDDNTNTRNILSDITTSISNYFYSMTDNKDPKNINILNDVIKNSDIENSCLNIKEDNVDNYLELRKYLTEQFFINKNASEKTNQIKEKENISQVLDNNDKEFNNKFQNKEKDKAQIKTSETISNVKENSKNSILVKENRENRIIKTPERKKPIETKQLEFKEKNLQMTKTPERKLMEPLQKERVSQITKTPDRKHIEAIQIPLKKDNVSASDKNLKQIKEPISILTPHKNTITKSNNITKTPTPILKLDLSSLTNLDNLDAKFNLNNSGLNTTKSTFSNKNNNTYEFKPNTTRQTQDNKLINKNEFHFSENTQTINKIKDNTTPNPNFKTNQALDLKIVINGSGDISISNSKETTSYAQKHSKKSISPSLRKSISATYLNKSPTKTNSNSNISNVDNKNIANVYKKAKPIGVKSNFTQKMNEEESRPSIYTKRLPKSTNVSINTIFTTTSNNNSNSFCESANSSINSKNNNISNKNTNKINIKDEVENPLNQINLRNEGKRLVKNKSNFMTTTYPNTNKVETNKQSMIVEESEMIERDTPIFDNSHKEIDNYNNIYYRSNYNDNNIQIVDKQKDKSQENRFSFNPFAKKANEIEKIKKNSPNIKFNFDINESLDRIETEDFNY